MTPQPCLTPQREQLFAAYPVCPRCEAEYLPLMDVDGCPWHEPYDWANHGKPGARQLSNEQRAADHRYDQCPICRKDYKLRRSPHCKACSQQARVKPGSRYGETCKCGAKKADGAILCRLCRYGVAA